MTEPNITPDTASDLAGETDIDAATAATEEFNSVSYTHLTLPTIAAECRSRWSPYH